MVQWRKQDMEPNQEISANSSAMQGASRIVSQDSAEQHFSLNLMSEWYVRPAMILTAFALFCGLLFNAATALWQVLDKPIVQLKVSGNTQYLDRQSLIEILLSGMQLDHQDMSLLSMDINALQQRTIEEPWVNSATIKRQWPPTINIQIDEQVPVAKWGSKGLLNYQGDIFLPALKNGLAHLPELNGPSTETARVMDQYHAMSQFFKGSDSLMVGLTLQARGAWTLFLDNHIEVALGRENIQGRLKRFLALYKGHLYLKAQQIERVDVRYTNGVAVKWRPVKQLDVEK
ncbi:MAG: hypothetical protein OFPII_06980 [Osedax symbiont Rs1]|nr:MAG: hypothetical protein OFPII_06980 [Osedax symbiont Rs1]